MAGARKKTQAKTGGMAEHERQTLMANAARMRDFYLWVVKRFTARSQSGDTAITDRAVAWAQEEADKRSREIEALKAGRNP